MEDISRQGLQVIVFGLLFAASACGPIQAYPGNERPSSQVAIVERECLADGGINNATIDNTTFCARSVAVLPGTHRFYLEYEQKSAPYDCWSEDEFDKSGYDYCRDEREKEIRKGQEERDCDLDDYYERVTYCTVDHFYYRCKLDAALEAGTSYQLRPYLRSDHDWGIDLTPEPKGSKGSFDCDSWYNEKKHDKQY